MKNDQQWTFQTVSAKTLWNFIGHSVLLGKSFHRTQLISVTLNIHSKHSFGSNIGHFGPAGNEANQTDHIFVLSVRRSDEFGGHCSNKTYRDHLILSSPEKYGGGLFVFLFLTYFRIFAVLWL